MLVNSVAVFGGEQAWLVPGHVDALVHLPNAMVLEMLLEDFVVGEQNLARASVFLERTWNAVRKSVSPKSAVAPPCCH